MSELLMGFDIGGTKCAVVVGQARPEGVSILGRKSFPTATTRAPRPTLDALESLGRELLAEQGLKLSEVRSLGISCGGPLDSRIGRVQGPPNLPGWDNVPIVEWCQKSLGVPTRLMNDANACALAEWQWGAGRGCQNMIFLTFGTGMGGGLVLNGRLYEGTNDLAGEVGHLRLAEDGPVGFGKAGSFEGFCSGGGMALAMRDRVPKGSSAISANDVFDLAAAGDPAAQSVVEQTGRYLGRGLAILVDMLNPERIILGSIFTRRRDVLWPIAKQTLEAEAIPGALAVCSVLPATLGESLGDCAALAAATLARKVAK